MTCRIVTEFNKTLSRNMKNTELMHCSCHSGQIMSSAFAAWCSKQSALARLATWIHVKPKQEAILSLIMANHERGHTSNPTSCASIMFSKCARLRPGQHRGQKEPKLPTPSKPASIGLPDAHLLVPWCGQPGSVGTQEPNCSISYESYPTSWTEKKRFQSTVQA